MPLPVVAALCSRVDSETGFLEGAFNFRGDLGDLGITMPGGGFLQAPAAPPQEIAEGVIRALSAALTPFQPIFNIIDAFVALGQFASAVPNPGGMAKALPKLLKAIDKLSSLAPALSVPRMIVDTVNALIAGLHSIRAQLLALVLLKNGIARANTRADEINSDLLRAVAQCAQAQLVAQMHSIEVVAAPLNRLLCLLNKLAELVHLPTLPELPTFGVDPEAALVLLDALIAALVALLDVIPRPPPSPTC